MFWIDARSITLLIDISLYTSRTDRSKGYIYLRSENNIWKFQQIYGTHLNIGFCRESVFRERVTSAICGNAGAGCIDALYAGDPNVPLVDLERNVPTLMRRGDIKRAANLQGRAWQRLRPRGLGVEYGKTKYKLRLFN